MDKYKLRFISVFILAALLLVAVVVLRPNPDSGLSKTLFWRQKLESGQVNEIVAVGDSRVLHCIVPEHFSSQGIEPGLNLGFRGAALNESLVEFAASRLKAQGERVLLVGVTPNSFTPNANQSNGFEQEQKNLAGTTFRFPNWLSNIFYANQSDGSDQEQGNRTAIVIGRPNWLSNILDRLQPSSLAEVNRIARGKTKPKSEHFHETGWIDTTHASPNEKEALKFFRHRFDQNQADAKRISEFLSMVKEYSTSGILVVCFRPPVTTEMAKLEDTLSGFSYAQFKTDLDEAGGIWIDAEDPELNSYDGSHLDGESARKLSATFAIKIKQHLGTKLKP